MYAHKVFGSHGRDSPAMGSPTLEKPRCKECCHRDVCIHLLQKKRPKMRERKIEAFNISLIIEECTHFLR